MPFSNLNESSAFILQGLHQQFKLVKYTQRKRVKVLLTSQHIYIHISLTGALKFSLHFQRCKSPTID